MLAKVNRKIFVNLYDLVNNVYPKQDVKLLERTGVFRYDYLDCFTRIDKLALLPQKVF